MYWSPTLGCHYGDLPHTASNVDVLVALTSFAATVLAAITANLSPAAEEANSRRDYGTNTFIHKTTQRQSARDI